MARNIPQWFIDAVVCRQCYDGMRRWLAMGGEEFINETCVNPIATHREETLLALSIAGPADSNPLLVKLLLDAGRATRAWILDVRHRKR